MKSLAASLLLATFALTGAVQAVDRKTLFLDKMDGFEVYIERAIQRQELNIELIEEIEHPDLKAMLGKRFKSVYAEVMYRKNTGRMEDSTLTVVDVKTGKPILQHNFLMGGDEASKQRNADEFVRKVKDLVDKNP
jgi:hypothetical protein